jgi:outer membrane protein TolC
LRNNREAGHNQLRPCARIILAVTICVSPAFAQSQIPFSLVPPRQTPTPPGSSLGFAPPTVTLQNALARAQSNEPQFLAAINAANLAREDTIQARAALYPTFGARSDYLNTQGNGNLPSGRYVTNDGVHVYREWATLHQDLSPGTLTRTGVQRTAALEAVARARAELARRGLVVTVTKAYYGLVNAQRKYATAQLALEQAHRLLTLTQDLERGGEVPHSDVVRAQLQYNAQDQAFREAQLSMGTTRLDLAVLLSPDFDQNFQVVDDLHLTSALPPLSEIQSLARRQNPDLRVAMENLRSASIDVTSARQAFLPTVAVDLVWGIEANQVGWNTLVAAFPQQGPVPSAGYFLTGSLTLPVWDWGARKSKLRQAQLRREQANVELSAAQRQLLRNLSGYYEEAQTARGELDLLRQSADLATENLRLNALRYQAGEATMLELVDTQNALNQARNAYDDGLVRYRLALANLQTLTGTF